MKKKVWLFGNWVIGIYLGFGIWCLGFDGAFTSSYSAVPLAYFSASPVDPLWAPG